jgi:hypothetical protein
MDEPDEDGDLYWFLEDGSDMEEIRDHENMIKIIKRKIFDPEKEEMDISEFPWRIWIEGETMNISSKYTE